ncbi:hypothetical protein [Silvibacterium dinghuense]|uniref:Uncharacterized protein n=1 Tax=Silvibacterium dinghuense TaxID=1560006 RepID=A0A4Q1SBJ2_9BACT|nr:hypothetical protein [Silvibacterium dinghuense]RXS94377.1 hypothetical protein ESZ00_14965 [Silvibacterium dinghuense]GGH16511.1 hypothetical protein GCM10011586_38380 [Silvibacterium dinghuense]
MERVLGVAIGISVVCLMLSIIASHLQELWASFTSRRAASLASAIDNMLGKSVAAEFFAHPLIQTISFSAPRVTVTLHDGKVSPRKQEGGAAASRPSYIPSTLFSRVLIAILAERHNMRGAPLHSLVEKVDDVDLKRRLQAVLEGTEQRAGASTLALEQWYDNTMDRINGLYKKNTQTILLYLGIALAVLCNANLFSITEKLWSSEDARTVLTTTAQMYSCRDAGGCTDERYRDARSEMTGHLERYIPVGYHQTAKYWRYAGKTLEGGSWDDRLEIAWSWVLHLAGWGLTGIAVSLGAPFWFDAVNKLINIRLAGDRPPRAEPPPIVAAPQVTGPVVNVVTPDAGPDLAGGQPGGTGPDPGGNGGGNADGGTEVVVDPVASGPST